jgi:hypothetical protein
MATKMPMELPMAGRFTVRDASTSASSPNAPKASRKGSAGGAAGGIIGGGRLHEQDGHAMCLFVRR